MTSQRSRSPSSPSEGEIVESGSDTKATTSQTSVNDINVDRNARTNFSAPRSPPRFSRYLSRSRSRSRSPYRASRGEKRRRDDDYEYERDDRMMDFNRSGRRYNNRYDGRNGRSRRQARDSAYDRGSRYDNDHDRRREKRPRTRSRSPYKEGKTARQPLTEERNSVLKSGSGGRKSSSEQLVSERGNPLVGAQNSRQEAEFRGNQVQHVSFVDGSGTSDSATAPTADAEPSEPVDEATLIEERRKRREAIKARYRNESTPQVQSPQLGNETGSIVPKQDTVPSAGIEAPGSRRMSPTGTPDETSGVQSPTDLDISKLEDLANVGVADSISADKEEPSAADYDPTVDMREDKIKHDKRHFGDDVSASAYDETKPAKQDVLVPESVEPTHMKAKDAFDMFADEDDDMFADEVSAPAEPAEGGVGVAKKTMPQELDMSMMDNWDDPEGYYNVMLGELIDGRYHVQQNLGKGMFSSVVRATDSKTGKLVAVKIIRNNDTMRKAGMKEIEILQQLISSDPDDKKHVIRFERHFDHKGHLCMVFENLSMNLREVLKKFGRDVGLNLRAIRAYAQQMFLGLSLLRKCNILHADLKPDNLLVNENRNLLKLCDLGSASPASENEITPYLVSRFYRAPEIILGIPYDYAIDVWSIGCTLFELYSGKILFTGRTNNQMLRSIMECRGKFPPKFLRRGTLTHMHFDDLLNFRSVEEDKITGRLITKVLDFRKPTRDLKTRLMSKGTKGMSDSEVKELNLFLDLLDRCLNVNPEKRCTPSEALKHPFIARSKA